MLQKRNYFLWRKVAESHSLGAQRRILLYLLPDGSRVNRQWRLSFSILWAQCRHLTLPMSCRCSGQFVGEPYCPGPGTWHWTRTFLRFLRSRPISVLFPTRMKMSKDLLLCDVDSQELKTVHMLHLTSTDADREQIKILT